MVAAPRLRFVSTNPGKYREVRAVFASAGLSLAWERRELPEPQADDLESVVRSKLGALRSDRAIWIVDDSGLFLPAWHGFPGVYSAYALRTIGLEGVLRLLRGRVRSATFRTVAGVRYGTTVRLFRGEVHGRIAARPRGRRGFGYDPIFVPEGWRRTFGEVTPAVKNQVSHRARAMTLAAAYLAGRHVSGPGRAARKER